MTNDMTEEYYEKHEMERDLGAEVEPYTAEEIDQMYEGLKALKEVVGVPDSKTKG